MRMHILGTGTAIVTQYTNTACVFEEGGELFLVDGTGGIDILRCFEKAGLDWNGLHHAFLSHEHTDHSLGMIWVIREIAELLELGAYAGDFCLYGHGEVLEKIRTVCEMLLKKKSRDYLGKRIFFVPVADRETREIWNHSFTFFDIGSQKAKQYGFVMTYDAGKCLVFAGDEPLRDAGLQYCRNADWLLAEAFCLYRDAEKYNPYQYSHQTVKETSELAQSQQVKNLLLWHTEDQTFGERKALYTQEAKQYFDGNVLVPEDGEIIIL